MVTGGELLAIDGQWAHAVLLEVVAWLEVDWRRRSMVADSRRKKWRRSSSQSCGWRFGSRKTGRARGQDDTTSGRLGWHREAGTVAGDDEHEQHGIRSGEQSGGEQGEEEAKCESNSPTIPRARDMGG
jgi:hypothetical protein